MRRKGKPNSSRQTKSGRYVCLFFSALEQTVDKLNTVLTNTATASDYVVLINFLPPEDGRLRWSSD